MTGNLKFEKKLVLACFAFFAASARSGEGGPFWAAVAGGYSTVDLRSQDVAAVLLPSTWKHFGGFTIDEKRAGEGRCVCTVEQQLANDSDANGFDWPALTNWTERLDQSKLCKEAEERLLRVISAQALICLPPDDDEENPPNEPVPYAIGWGRG